MSIPADFPRPDDREPRDFQVPSEPGYHEVPTEMVQPCPWTTRHGQVPAEADEELDRSVRQHGILHPILVLVDRGSLVVIAGMRRLASAKRVGREPVPVRLLNVTRAEAVAISALENTARQATSVWSQVTAVAEFIRATPNATVEQIAQYLSWSTGKVSVRRKIAAAIDESVVQLAYVGEENMTLLTLAELEGLADEPNPPRRVDLLRQLVAAKQKGDANAETATPPATGVDPADPSDGRGEPRPHKRLGGAKSISSIRITGDRSSIGVSRSHIGPDLRPRVVAHLSQFADSLAKELPGLAEAIRGWAAGQGINLPKPGEP